jgi:O-acetyl-ADP-ribose deacetylase (regulator of RNase III)
VGKAKHTVGYNLPAKYIIHTVAPKYHLVVYEKPREELLADCYRNVLNLAHSLNITSISFPSLGTGVNGWPHNESAKIMLTTIHQWLSENKSDMTIRILLPNTETVSVYTEKLDRLIPI